MSIAWYLNKFVGLLKTLRNPPLFLYRLCHYLNKYVPYGVAVYIYIRNKKEYEREGVVDFLLETYDGSGQVVHPDIAYYENQYWLTVTPYPYGMEEYENPCIYQGDDLNNLEMPQGPIAVQRKHTQGVHLSDPCFAINYGILYCYYRESERKGDIEEQTIWGVQYMESSKSWDHPVLLLDSVDDKILSPAMVYNENGELTVYYVSSMNGMFKLVSTKAEGVINQLTEHHIVGAPEEYFLWHIGISKVKDIQTEECDSNMLAGLFLFESKNTSGKMKLFETRNNGVETDWQIIKEVQMPESIKDIIAFPYKSCYIPKTGGKILLSFRDKKCRNRMIIINNNK